MSYQYQHAVWETPCQSHTQKLVLAALAIYADELKPLAHPSVETLARRCNLSDRAVREQLSALRKVGLISLAVEGGGRHQVNTYRLNIQNPEQHSGNGIQGIGFSESRSKNPERRSKNPEQGSAQVPGSTNEVPGGIHLPFLRELESQIRRAQEERERLKCAFAVEHSLNGTTWTRKDKKSEYDSWGKVSAESKEAIRTKRYRV